MQIELRRFLPVAVVVLACAGLATAQTPPITGAPSIDGPRLLDWPADAPAGLPDLTEETANRLFDLHGDIASCGDVDLVLSTAGNYHMALRDLWRDVLLPTAGDAIRTWYYTTSPPISPEQIANENVTFGNLALRCTPQVAVGPNGLIQTLIADGVTEGDPIPIIRNRGNVLLVKKGNPRHIRSVWSLARPFVRFVTSNPDTEPGSFGNYSTSLYQIALMDPSPPVPWFSAEDLFDAVFNRDRPHPKWLAGGRIHHREVPWSVAFGRADAGMLFYHLALHAVRTFPDRFDIVPLGGTVEDPQPVAGNRIATLFAVRIAGDWTPRQLVARELLLDAFLSEDFTTILDQAGLDRP